MMGSVFYVGTNWPGSTSLARMNAMISLGLEVIPFDVTPYLQRSSWFVRQLSYRLATGPAIRRLNTDVLAMAREHSNRMDQIWIDKGVWLLPETVQELRSNGTVRLIHYTPDPQVDFQVFRNRRFIASIPSYDVLFTTKPFELGAYRRHGARRVYLVNQSYNDIRIGPREMSAEDRERLGSDVCFIGHCEPQRVAFMRAAAQTGSRVRVWGYRWRNQLRGRPWLRSIFSGDGLWGDDYCLALNATRIGLCFLTKQIPETTTTRTFEIPGSGTFMLAQRTPAHKELFEEGREAEFFDDAEELVDKVRYYLANAAARDRIAAAGLARCRSSGYGDRARVLSLLQLARGAQAEAAIGRQ